MKKFALTVFIICISVLSVLPANARKASDRPFPYRQPDGSTILLSGHGDEFFHYTTTSDGCLVLSDQEGWLCYAFFDAEGLLQSSGVRLQDKLPGGLMAKCKIIPAGLGARHREEKLRVLQDSKLFAARNHLQNTTGSSNRPVEGERYGLVILAAFSDVPFTYSQEDFVNMLTQKGYSKFDAQGCAAEYFNDQFGEKVEFHFDVSPIVTLPEKREFYGKNNRGGEDQNPEAMIATACQLADAEIDFSKYDADGDKIVDNVFVFFAGNDEAETRQTDCIWSHAYYIYSGHSKTDLVLDNVRIDRYACTSELTIRGEDFRSEMAGIGTFCHEYSHTFGLPDFYDTDYELSGGTAPGFWGTTCLMDAGNHNNEGNTPPYYNAVEREMLGLATPVEITQSGTYTLTPIQESGQCYRISTSHPDEYFLLEARYPERWDSFCGGQGMLVYHIDRSDRLSGYSDSYKKEMTAAERWGTYNEVNCRPDHQCAELIAAEPLSQKAGTIFYPQPEKAGIPNSRLRFWDASESGVSIRNIRQEGKNIVFEAQVNEDNIFPINVNAAAFQNSALIDFESYKEVSQATVICSMAGKGEISRMTVKPYAPKKFSAKLENLTSNTQFVIEIHLEGQSVEAEAQKIQTLPFSPLSFIHVYKAPGRYTDGTYSPEAYLPLEAVCKKKPEKIIWTFNGEPVSIGENFRWHIPSSGMLKAEIFYPDGEKETITKKLKVK